MGCCTCKKNDPFLLNKDIYVKTVQNEKGDHILTTNEVFTDKDKNSMKAINITQGKPCLNSLQNNKTEISNKSNNQKIHTNTNDKRVRDTSQKLKQITFIEVTNIKKFFS